MKLSKEELTQKFRAAVRPGWRETVRDGVIHIELRDESGRYLGAVSVVEDLNHGRHGGGTWSGMNYWNKDREKAIREKGYRICVGSKRFTDVNKALALFVEQQEHAEMRVRSDAEARAQLDEWAAATAGLMEEVGAQEIRKDGNGIRLTFFPKDGETVGDLVARLKGRL